LTDRLIWTKNPNVTAPEWMTPLVPAVEAIVALLHPHLEAVVHDVPRDEVLAIWNPLSGRRPGDPSLLEADLLAGLADGTVLGPYEKVDVHGRHWTSVSVPLAAGRAVLCLNFDRSVLETAVAALTGFAAAVRPRPAALFERDWREEVNVLVDDWCRAGQVSRRRLTTGHRRELVALLDSKGVFDVRHAASHVATALGVSRATVYSMLKDLRTG
jgi:predicted transcriptional regulator YheO